MMTKRIRQSCTRRAVTIKKIGSYYITYEESETTGFAGCRTVLKVDGANKVSLFLDSQKLRNFLISVRNEADGRCLVDMYFVPGISTSVLCSGALHILREASASLLVRLRWAMRRPLTVERATVQTSRFLFAKQSNANERVRRRFAL